MTLASQASAAGASALASVQTPLLIVWIAFSVLSLLAVSAVLVWAVRARQFAGQDHARYLPLESGIPEDGPGDDGKANAEPPGPDAGRVTG